MMKHRFAYSMHWQTQMMRVKIIFFKFKTKAISFKVAYPTLLFFGVISSHCWVGQLGELII